MSLLLDALKKAALEKQRRDQAGGELPEASDPTPAEPSGTNPASPKPTQTDTDWALDIESPTTAEPAPTPTRIEQEPAADEGFGEPLLSLEDPADLFGDTVDEEQPPTDARTPEPTLSLLDNETPENTVAVPDEPDEEPDSPLSMAEHTDPADRVPTPLPASSLGSQSEPAQAAKPATPAPEPEPTTPVPAATGTATPFQPEQGKAAMAQLINNSEQAARREKRRRILWLSALAITAGIMIGAYYYYLQNAQDIQMAPLPQRPATPLTDPIEAADPVAAEQEAPVSTVLGSDIEDTQADAPVSAITEQPADDQPLNTLSAASTEPVPEPDAPIATVASTAPAYSEPASAPSAPALADTPAATTPKTITTPSPQASVPQPDTQAPPAAVAESNANNTTGDDNAAGDNAPAHRIQTRRQISRVAPPLETTLQQAYQHFQQGDLVQAESEYLAALRIDPQQRDALLGLAAVQIRQGRYDQALRRYQQRLQTDPRDLDARAGMLGLLAINGADPGLHTELNLLLREQPEAAYLYFLKGSLAIGQQQWRAAQQAFFDALQRDPANPDYAFNLAVSLDHLVQPREALRYYRLALSWREARPASFDVDAAQRRVATLEARLP